MRLERYLPLGMEKKPISRWLLGGALLGLVFDISFLNNYQRALSTLYQWYNGKKVLQSTLIAPFTSLLGYSPYGCLIALISMIPLAWYLWNYHFQESKSIYTMRRLPQKGELLRRCGTVPALGACLYLLEFVALMLLNFAIYWSFTPKQCLPPFSWAALFGG